MKTKKTKTVHFEKSIRRSPVRRGLLLIPVLFGCFALSPTAPAVSPAPDGGYSGNNTAEGTNALFNLNTGTNNTANGFAALYHTTSGINNTANGYQALWYNATGNLNTAIGFQALKNNRSSINTAVGANALLANTTGNYNTAIGYSALDSNTIGVNNTAVGNSSALHNVGGHDNLALGVSSLYTNTSGNFNTAIGRSALAFSTGDENTASGYQALYSNTDGDGNTAIGSQALFHNTGSDNVALGYVAGYYLTNGSNNIDIGNPGIAGESHTIRIGNNSPDQTRVFLGGDIYNNFSHNMSLRFVTVDIYGRLGSTDGVAPPPSSRRFKDNVKPMDKASEAILALKPVTFRYKKELDPKGLSQFGLVAEEVQKVNPDLVARDAKGEIYTVRYDAVNAMLLNEFLKEHRTVQELKSTVAKQTATILQQKKDFQEIASQQQKQIDALTAGLQKVSAQLETNKPAPQVVNNP